MSDKKLIFDETGLENLFICETIFIL